MKLLTRSQAAWAELVVYANGRTTFGQVGVRDPEFPCVGFDKRGYDGTGRCDSDGHYMCTECSDLAPDAPRFTGSRDGRRDRLRLYWHRPGGPINAEGAR